MSFVSEMHIFARVAELSSFSQAAASLGMPKARVSTTVQQLEARLGARLLHRTTRKVELTHDGRAFYERCKDALTDIDELQSMFQAAGELRGRVRIDMTGAVARNAVFPRLPELLAAQPLLEIEIGGSERRVDLVREGYDFVLRSGEVVDPALIARPIAELIQVNCASPAYLRTHGQPERLEDLDRHLIVHYATSFGARPDGFDYVADGEERTVAMRGALTVNNADSYQAACLAGLGIVQAPLIGVRDHLDTGRLVEVLPRHRARPLPLNLLYVSRRNLPQRVRYVMDWIAGIVGAYVAERHAGRS